MIIKVCGLKEKEHALSAARAGADLIGFVFAGSPRRVTPEQAGSIIRELPGTVKKVGVFVDEDSGVVNDIISRCGLDMVQLHGRETPDYCGEIICPVIKAFRIRDAETLNQMIPYRDKVEMFLMDTYVQGTTGGTGKTFDWSLARRASDLGKVLLAGGLTHGNVRTAIELAKPYGVDVSSGVETGGVKDITKIEAFIAEARGNQDVRITG
ncbi:MAG: phosphoribosylanthranilate isomerase [Firmicutes bacterium HGW-Firmicutes-14]|nr:MAG: phosphoribosylanthranilate isomerase [Firmicutes bacterium HGW-Firmicutes-14]